MKHIIVTLSLLALVSCKDNKSQDTKTETVEHSAETHNDHDGNETSVVYANTWISEIHNDNGAKWQANVETNEGVERMKNSIKTQSTNTLDEYYKLVDKLNSDKNYVIKNCTMKGASHDNLHVWLLPLMAKIEALSEAKTMEEASKIKSSIEENVNAYSNYFQ